jgi:hypothetical protein
LHDLNPPLVRADGYVIRHVLGDDRKGAQRFIEAHHYAQSNGNSGAMYAAFAPDGAVVGACLIGAPPSNAAERSIGQEGAVIRQCKRLVAADDSPIPESQLLWQSLRREANRIGRTLIAISYADTEAIDERTGTPLTGRLYLAANHYFIGDSRRRRQIPFDEHGRMRSTRQGARTLTKATLPHSWTMQCVVSTLRLWCAIVVPTVVQRDDGTAWETSRRWRKRQWREAGWRKLAPQRRVAARQWTTSPEFQRLQRDGVTPLGDPVERNATAQLQAALWRGEDVRHGAAPLWVPYLEQRELALDEDAERTAQRVYRPRERTYPHRA